MPARTIGNVNVIVHGGTATQQTRVLTALNRLGSISVFTQGVQ